MATLSTWQAIADNIERDIAERVYAPGDRLPTEMALARKFMVNRHTVRRALLHLQEKNIVETTQGRGTFVRAPCLTYALNDHTRFTQNLQAQNKFPNVETRIASIKKATLTVARALQIEVGDDVSFIERVGYANNEPISISSHYYSYNKFPPLIRMYHTHQSITKTLQSLGTGDYTRTKTLITSRLPNSQECELLNVPKHVPLLITQGVDVDAMQQPIGFIEARFASDRVDLQV